MWWLRRAGGRGAVVWTIIALACARCSGEASNETPIAAPATTCSMEIEYSRHDPVAPPPLPTLLGKLDLDGDDVSRVTFVAGDGPRGSLDSLERVEIALSASGEEKVSSLHGDTWGADAPIASRAVIQVVVSGARRDRFRIVAGHPAPIRVLAHGPVAILQMPLIEGSLSTLPADLSLDRCEVASPRATE